MDKLERLRALEKAVEMAAKATPGPWAQEHRRGSDSSYRTEVFDEHGEAIATLTWHAKPPTYQNGMRTTSTDRAENAEAIVACVNFIREHGSALIAELGQEVGAVAWTDDRGLERLREGKQEMVSGVRLGSDTTALYTSPANTSVARDAARYRWLRDAARTTDFDTPRWTVSFESGGWGETYRGETLDKHIDAAMEGGNG